MRLDIGATRAQKIGVVILTVVVLVLFALLGYGFGAIVGSPEAGVALAFLLMLVPGLAMGLVLLSVFRSGAWLEGTTLVQRRTFGTRRCDLATAPEVSVDSVPQTTTVMTSTGSGGTTAMPVATGGRIPRLIIRCASGRRPVRVPLRSNRGTFLPPEQLRAIAAAITAGRREPAHDEHARTVARGLIELADNPLMQAL
jgi:hypothetical protein